MGFIYGLAVILIIYEGIIIHCEGAGGVGGTEDGGAGGVGPSNWRQDPSNIVTKEEQQLLKKKLVDMIDSKTLYQTLQKAVQNGATDPLVSEILQNCIFVIKTDQLGDETVGGIHEYYEEGDLFLKFGDYAEFDSFFEKFGDQVKKIEFDNSDDIYIVHDEIHMNIIHHIKRCADNLEELRMKTVNDVKFWEDISSGRNGTIFPEVKMFQLEGDSFQYPFKLDLFFPKLETFNLYGEVYDKIYLDNVVTLKEIALITETMEEDKLDVIFGNNMNMTTIVLYMPSKMVTMHSIEGKLKQLQTLDVRDPEKKFLLRRNGNPVCKLLSVNHFRIRFHKKNEQILFEELSFDMPGLNKLTFIIEHYQPDNRIVKFTKHFKHLEEVEFLVKLNHTVKCIEKLQHIKQLTTAIDEIELDSLKKMFENFDERSLLQTLKLEYRDELLFKTHETEMTKVITHLKESKNSTWTLSHEKEIGTNKLFLIFRRKL